MDSGTNMMEVLDAKHWVCSLSFKLGDINEIVFGTTNGIVGCLHFPNDVFDVDLVSFIHYF